MRQTLQRAEESSRLCRWFFAKTNGTRAGFQVFSKIAQPIATHHDRTIIPQSSTGGSA
jgi:hypothetical protein